MMDIHYVSIYHRTFNFYISIEKQDKLRGVLTCLN
nr:MAG TPA: hypothetical protein [Caudoviricetes sp.]